jgi:hypothetical protein
MLCYLIKVILLGGCDEKAFVQNNVAEFLSGKPLSECLLIPLPNP